MDALTIDVIPNSQLHSPGKIFRECGISELNLQFLILHKGKNPGLTEILFRAGTEPDVILQTGTEEISFGNR